MADIIKTWTIRPHIKGDTFNSRKITFPFDITDCRIDMQFRKQANDKIEFAWSTEDDTFEKISSTEVIMKSVKLNNNASFYYSDLQIIFLNETVYTYFKAQIHILQDITEITL
jgi:hypothetical protein